MAPVLPETSGDITVDQGETAVLSCENDAKPTPKVQWSKNGETIELVSIFLIIRFYCFYRITFSCGRHHVICFHDVTQSDEMVEGISFSRDGQVLTVTNAQERDAGRYVCVVSNKAGIQTKYESHAFGIKHTTGIELITAFVNFANMQALSSVHFVCDDDKNSSKHYSF